MKHFKRIRLPFSLIVPAFLFILAACGTSTTANTSTPTPTNATIPTPTPAATGAVVQTATETVGGKSVTALTNEKGWTLYYFTPDTATTSACTTAPCTTTWPALTSDGTPTSASKLSGKLDVQKNANGSQVTYNSHPLYTYSKDTGAAQTNGEGVGGKWHVATTDLAALAGGGDTVQTTSATVNGKTVTLLTNAKGWTLYYFTPDTATTSACTGGCATTWPPFLSNSVPTSTGNLPGKFALQNNANGSQVTYNGHPLYTYGGDTAAGQTNGEGVGGKWHVATTDLAQLSGNPTPTPSSGGYNY